MVAHTQPVLFVVPNFLILGLGYTLEQNSSFSPKLFTVQDLKSSQTFVTKSIQYAKMRPF